MSGKKKNESFLPAPPAHVIAHIAAPITTPPVLDGKLDDPCWRGLPEVADFFDCDSPRPQPSASRTVMKVGYTTKGLYIGIRCDDENAGAIRATITRQGDPNLWTDDCLELYFGGVTATGKYRQFVVNAVAAQTEYRVQKDGVPAVAGEPVGWQAAASRDERGWSAEVFFPFADLGARMTGAAGEVCRFALRRFVYSAKGRSAVSVPHAGAGHPEAFGWLVLAPAESVGDLEWVGRQLSRRIKGDWILPHGRECVWKRGRTIQKAVLSEAIAQAVADLRGVVEDVRAGSPQHAVAAARGAARLDAVAFSEGFASTVLVLSEIGDIHCSLRNRHVAAEHGVVCRLPGEKFGYFGWPTVARLDDGALGVVSSGLRSEHVCPWGKTVLNVSRDDGRTWSAPKVINDSPIDDRDAGVVNLGGNRLLVSWFTSDTRMYLKQEWVRGWLGAEEVDSWQAKLATVTDAIATKHIGSWVMLSEDRGATWSAPIRAPVSTPHGPICLRSGELLYLGKPYGTWADMDNASITAARSADHGCTWQVLGQVPVFPGTDPANYHEPHVVELSSGKLLGMIRVEDHNGKELKGAGITTFSMMQTESDDGGRTWSTAKPLGFHGSPPHLLRHSSGTLILTYGYRLAPFGQRVAFSRDEGATWDHDWIIRDDGPDSDLGYPSTVELADKSLFTVCYQKVTGDKKCSLLWSQWRIGTD